MRPPAAGTERRRRGWRIVRIVSGSALLALGAIGLVVPVLQGWALILGGLAVLARDVPWARRWLHAIRERLRRLRPSARRRDQRAKGDRAEAEDGDAPGGSATG